MSINPGFLDELRSRVSLSDVAARKLVWDSKKSNPAKGDYWACCPFHQEKTASFHIEDRKGFYYCFGCHEKGGIIDFVMKTENLSFIEAVETLAREAGMPMPARSARSPEEDDRRKKLFEAMETAARFFRTQFNSAEARAAREYLETRRMKPETRKQFEIGFAPAARTALSSALGQRGIPPDILDEAGLTGVFDDGARFDRFRDRIIFPIRDPQGRCIGFGGRAMDPDARAKYLNSPETPLFHKGRALYNHGPARQAAGKQPLIVAEGYMDVIALVAAGFEASVAPLGTAITEDQLRLLWRMADEPILALDGDEAGIRAAMRVIDLALPMLEAGKSLRFALMPEGKDPDDLLREGGADAVQETLDRAETLVGMLWRRETEGKDFSTPERRAALDRDLRRLLSRIPDGGLRKHYAEAIAERRATLFRPAGGPRMNQGRTDSGRGDNRFAGPGGGRRFGPRVSLETRRSALAQGDGESALRGLEAAVLLALLNHPGLLERFEAELAAMDFLHPDLDMIRTALISTMSEAFDLGQTLTRDELLEAANRHAGTDVAMALEAHRTAKAAPFTSPAALDAQAGEGIEIAMARLAAASALKAELAEAETAFNEEGGERAYRRLMAAQAAFEQELSRGLSGPQEEESDNSERLQSFIDQKIWIKRRGTPPKPR